MVGLEDRVAVDVGDHDALRLEDGFADAVVVSIDIFNLYFEIMLCLEQFLYFNRFLLQFSFHRINVLFHLLFDILLQELIGILTIFFLCFVIDLW